MTSRVVDNLISHKRWDDVMARVKTGEGRGELGSADANTGARPIHLAIEHGAPLEVVDAIVEGCPEAVRVSKGVYGDSIALHLACSSPKYGYEISPPLVRLLLDTYPEGAKAAHGTTLPIHIAASWNAPLRVLRMLRDANPEGITTPDMSGKLPIHYISCRPTFDVEKDLEKILLLLCPLLDDEEACLIPDRGSGETALHVAYKFDVLRLQTYVKIPRCPPEIIMKVARRHPGQLREMDEDGNLPLHVAASNPNPDEDGDPPSYWYMISFDPDLEGSGDSSGDKRDVMIASLARLCPDAAASLNADGRSPLVLAIESGKDWYDAVEAITAAAEHMIMVRDEATNLYPFMLAATVDSPCINMVYSLLRRGPELRRYILN